MVDEVVWVFGVAGIGKKAFMKMLVKNAPKYLIGLFGWKGKRISTVRDSLTLVSRNEDDPIMKERAGIIDKVANKRNKNSVVLIKGLDYDIENSIPQLLMNKLPNAKHRVIYLYTEISVLYEKIKKQKWWGENKISLNEFKIWMKHGIRLIQGMTGFEVTAIDNSNEYYQEIQFPPII